MNRYPYKALFACVVAILVTSDITPAFAEFASTGKTLEFQVTPSGIVGSATQTIMGLGTAGAQINGGVQAVLQGATAGNSCIGAGTMSYDVTNDQMIYCSSTGQWQLQGSSPPGTFCGSAVNSSISGWLSITLCQGRDVANCPPNYTRTAILTLRFGGLLQADFSSPIYGGTNFYSCVKN